MNTRNAIRNKIEDKAEVNHEIHGKGTVSIDPTAWDRSEGVVRVFFNSIDGRPGFLNVPVESITEVGA